MIYVVVYLNLFIREIKGNFIKKRGILVLMVGSLSKNLISNIYIKKDLIYFNTRLNNN